MLQRLRNAILWLMSWRTRRFWLMVVVGFPVAYVLSYGLWFRSVYWNTFGDIEDNHISFALKTTRYFFEPIAWLDSSSTAMRDLHVKYLDLWLPNIECDVEFAPDASVSDSSGPN